MANKDHVAVAREGCAAIEAWRKKHSSLVLDLSGGNLAGVDLAKAPLNGVVLSDADLSSALLVDARLNKANMSQCKLGKADLRHADLSRANARKATLKEACLIGARLHETYLKSANLREADLSDADLTGANLTEADLTGAILKGAFGEHYGAELDGVLNGDACANQENDRTFVVAWRAGGVVHAAGVVAERRVFQGKAAPRKVVWEVLWLCAPSDGRNRGHGSRAWAALAALAAARRVEEALADCHEATKAALGVLQQEMAEVHRTFQAAYPGRRQGIECIRERIPIGIARHLRAAILITVEFNKIIKTIAIGIWVIRVGPKGPFLKVANPITIAVRIAGITNPV